MELAPPDTSSAPLASLSRGGAIAGPLLYLFAGLLLFSSGEDDEATSPSFASANAGIDASSALLEALIAT